METLAGVLAVGVALVVPQIVGFAASRRRRRAIVWALAAAGTVAVFWGISALAYHRAAEHARAMGRFRRGSAQDAVDFVTPFLLVAHFVAGGILGALDRRARAS